MAVCYVDVITHFSLLLENIQLEYQLIATEHVRLLFFIFIIK